MCSESRRRTSLIEDLDAVYDDDEIDSVVYPLGWLKDGTNGLLKEAGRYVDLEENHTFAGTIRTYIPPANKPFETIFHQLPSDAVCVTRVARRVSDDLYIVFYETEGSLCRVDLPLTALRECTCQREIPR